MKKIIFRGLGPGNTATLRLNEDEKPVIVEDGAIVIVDDDIANAYIKNYLAYEVKSEAEAATLQNQVIKNKQRRETIAKKAGAKNE